MSIDMYGEKVAEASALIREFAKVDYYYFFARDMESSMEEFIAMMDSCREEGRVKGRGEALAELNPHWLGQKERADQLQAQLEEAEALIAQTSHGAAERISELEAQVAWQPIETAPKDGTQIMLTNGKDVAQGWWEHQEPYIREQRDTEGHYIDQQEHDGFDGWLDCEGGMQPDPTHWMPLPAAPSTVEG